MKNPVLQEVEQWLISNDLGAILSSNACSGGCICESYQVHTSKQAFFVKLLSTPLENMFAAEAEGLNALRKATSLCVPNVIGHSKHFLILQDLNSGAPARNYWSTLGEGLAEIHYHAAECYGFTLDNFCGKTPQPNPRIQNGHDFFAQHRLLYQAKLAVENREINNTVLQQIELLCERLPNLIPTQIPVLLHGDLWSGNVMSNHEGQPALIDPAAYWGWAEADIAMTQLFGGFPSEFYQTYIHHHPLEAGWQERMDLYNLYHLLNHVNLFGGSYLASVKRTLNRYC